MNMLNKDADFTNYEDGFSVGLSNEYDMFSLGFDNDMFEFSQEIPAPFVDNLNGDQQNILQIQTQKYSRKYIYKKGPETQKLKTYKHYNKDHTKCKVFMGLNRPKKPYFQMLGKEYNQYFRAKIKNNEMPKFKRDYSRNLGLAVWFFEDILTQVQPWLSSTKNFHL